MEVGIKVLFGVVVRGDLMPLAAFLVQAKPPALAPLPVVILNPHSDHGADTMPVGYPLIQDVLQRGNCHEA